MQNDSTLAIVANVVDQHTPLIIGVIASAVELGDLAKSLSIPLSMYVISVGS